jgi:hypothetical protein
VNIKDFHVKKLGKRGKIVIWEVDGQRVRAKLDEEFTNFSQHYEFKFIPEYEFWLDCKCNANERKFFIQNLLVQWKLMRKGVTQRQAFDAGNAEEKAERAKSAEYSKALTKKGEPSLKQIHEKLLGKTKKGLSVYLISGSLVRDFYKVNFVSGGHGLVYDFVAEDEVWLDDGMDLSEIPYVLLHELYERRKMKKGLTYNQAHRFASKIEWKARHAGDTLKKELHKLGWDSN